MKKSILKEQEINTEYSDESFLLTVQTKWSSQWNVEEKRRSRYMRSQKQAASVNDGCSDADMTDGEMRKMENVW